MFSFKGMRSLTWSVFPLKPFTGLFNHLTAHRAAARAALR